MSSSTQSLIAFALVALAAAYLVRVAIKKRRHPGCGDDCGAISPEVRKLQAKLKR